MMAELSMRLLVALCLAASLLLGWPLWLAAPLLIGPTYFCFNYAGDSRPTLPFAWRDIGAICMDRNRQATPERVVVVGLRLPAPAEPAPPLPVLPVRFGDSR